MSKRTRRKCPHSKAVRLEKLEAGLAWCMECEDWRPVEEFRKGAGPGGLRTYCKECHAKTTREWCEANKEHVKERSREWREANLERVKKKNREWREANKEHVAEIRRRWRKANQERAAKTSRNGLLRRKYGLTESDFHTLLESQGGRCAVTGDADPGSKYGWHIDHDHSFERGDRRGVRGVLSHRANAILIGSIEKLASDMQITEEELLERVIDYIRNNRLRTQAVLDQRRNSENDQ